MNNHAKLYQLFQTFPLEGF